MEKKIMIAVDDSLQAKCAVDYAVAMRDTIDPLTITLCHVQPPISQYLEQEAAKNAKAKAQLDALLRKNDAASKRLLEEMKSSAVLKGMSPDSVEIQTHMHTAEMDRILLRTAEDRHYDALVLGRRGISGIQKAFIDSVTDSVMHQRTTAPIWLVKGKVRPSDNILLAVDGSQNAFRAADHLAFMISESKNARVTLLHVRPTLKSVCPISNDDAATDQLSSAASLGDQQCMDDFLERTLARFKESGIGEDRLEILNVDKTLNIGKAVLNHAQKNGFSTIVIGRRGISRTFFTGSVSQYMIERMPDLALWVVQ
jgi:nucleotide-binding universal stress UspA family protein